jgi:predicted nucleic acid-binding protein
MLIDTDVLIWYMRGNARAARVIEKQNGFSVSVVNYIELVQGMRNKNELIELRKAFKEWDVNILYIDEKITAKAMFYIENYYLSHSLNLADALISATAIMHGLPLITGNDKYYKQINELEIIRFKP